MRHPDQPPPAVRESPVRVSEAWLWWGLFFLLSFLFLWLRVDPALRYHQSAPAFLLEGSFLAPVFAYPGGILDGIGSMLAQCDFHSWLGAGIGASLAAACAVLLGLLFRPLAHSTSLVVSLPTLFLGLYLATQYTTLSWVIVLGQLLILSAVVCHKVWILNRSPVARLAGCWGSLLVILYVAGTWWFLLATVLFALIEFFRYRVVWITGGCLGVALVQPLLGMLFPAIPIESNLPTVGGFTRGVLWALLASLPLALVVASLLGRREAHTAELTGRHPKHGAKTRGGAFGSPWVVPVMMFAGFAGLWFGVDDARKSRIQVSACASRGDWHGAIAAASRCPQLDAVSGIQLVRALDHVGRLPEDLMSFAWPDRLELLPGLDGGLDTLPAQSEVLLEIGQVNLAEHYAHEALELRGERPDLLVLLAKVNLLKNRPVAARIFLRSLKSVPFRGREAEETLRALDKGGAFPASWRLEEIRPFQPTSDEPGGTIASEDTFQLVLRGKPGNRRALNYLISHWLLTRQPSRLAAGLRQLAEGGYTTLPRPCEEALLLSSKKKDASALDLQGFRIRPDVAERFAQLWQRLAQTGGLDQATMERDYRGTYWLYSFSREAGEGGGRR